MEGTGYIPEERPINDAERELLLWLLRNGVPGAQLLTKQVDGLRVKSKCSCGCPTVDFEISGEAKPMPRILADVYGKTAKGEEVGVILWADEGRISSLEVYGIEAVDNFGLPLINTLTDMPRK